MATTCNYKKPYILSFIILINLKRPHIAKTRNKYIKSFCKEFYLSPVLLFSLAFYKRF